MGYITATSIEEAQKQVRRFNRTHTNKQYLISSVRRVSKTAKYSGALQENLYSVRLA